jgi:ATP synthase protein I
MDEDQARLIDKVSSRARDMQASRDGFAPSAKPAKGAGQMGIGLRVSVDLVAAVAVGAGIGIGLDRWLGTAPWLLVAMLPMGFAAGVFNAVRLSAAADRASAAAEGDGEGADAPREEK